MYYQNMIRALREDSDKTQKDIANLLGTTQQQYSKYENGMQELPIRHLITLCEYYQVSSDYVLGLPTGLNWPREGTKIVNINQRDNGTNNITF